MGFWAVVLVVVETTVVGVVVVVSGEVDVGDVDIAVVVEVVLAAPSTHIMVALT